MIPELLSPLPFILVYDAAAYAPRAAGLLQDQALNVFHLLGSLRAKVAPDRWLYCLALTACAFVGVWHLAPECCGMKFSSKAMIGKRARHNDMPAAGREMLWLEDAFCRRISHADRKCGCDRVGFSTVYQGGSHSSLAWNWGSEWWQMCFWWSHTDSGRRRF